jgi:dihydrofolate reductase
MRVSLVVAMAANRVIGRDGTLPWSLPADLKNFKRVTLNKAIIMGRKTWESLPARPLPDRHNIILTRRVDFRANGGTVVRGLDEAFDHALGSDEVMVIGGEEIYRLALPRADRIYLTEVLGGFEGDARFPDLGPADWREVSREDHEAVGEHPAYSFLVLERVLNFSR